MPAFEPREHSFLHRRNPAGLEERSSEPEPAIVPRDGEPGDSIPGGASQPGGTAVAISVVVVTLSPTFSGPVAGFSTVGESTTPSAAAAAHSTTAPPAAASTSATPSSSPKAAASSSTLASSISTTPVGQTPSAQPASQTAAPASAAAATSTPSSAPQDAGLSGGAKAGVAVAVLLILAALAAAAFLFWRRRQRSAAAHTSEKTDPFADHAAPSQAANANAHSNVNQMQMASMAAPVAAPKPHSPPPPKSPFGDDASVAPATQPSLPPALRVGTPVRDSFGRRLGDDAALGAAGAALAGAAGTRSPAAGAAAPGSAVHRVQLDFKPSMDDELELTNGQLVRVLHEYDDGWALCMKFDRSAQGVAPRTCLSARPVQPKPKTPSNGPSAAATPNLSHPPGPPPVASSSPRLQPARDLMNPGQGAGSPPRGLRHVPVAGATGSPALSVRPVQAAQGAQSAQAAPVIAGAHALDAPVSPVAIARKPVGGS